MANDTLVLEVHAALTPDERPVVILTVGALSIEMPLELAATIEDSIARARQDSQRMAAEAYAKRHPQ